MIAAYTRRHMENLQRDGRTFERFFISTSMDHEARRLAEQRARTRIRNAADRLGVHITTSVHQDATGPYIDGRIKEES